ncbi:MAG: hypothetical protein KAQ96_05100, partial [Thermoplasmata archaeon]|nr:hypothetical protein [Thermoplasmata archaeon]
MVAMTVISGEVVIAEDRGDPTPPPDGDWNITEDTTLDGMDVTVSGNINVTEGVNLTIRNSTLRVMRDFPGQYIFILREGFLVVENSTLHLDSFESWLSSSISITRGSVVSTTGRFSASSQEFHAEGSTIENIAPAGENDKPGVDAIMLIGPETDSELRNMTIRNYGGYADMWSPGMNGSQGGSSEFLCTVTTIVDSLIDCRAGDSRGGGLGLTGLSGGHGGTGPTAVVRLTATFLEGVEVTARGGDGGAGARGSRNTAGNGGHGGDGAEGGIALVTLESPTILEMYNVTISAKSGNGGSGGNGGEAIDGDGGTAGYGANAGTCSIEISSTDDIIIEDSTFTALGGEGGYGGDYGRHEGGTGSFGIPRPGGYGGDALVEIMGQVSMYLEDLKIEVRGGHGLDGGGGYEQGETGGNGAEGTIQVHAKANIETVGADLRATGGNGGPGGPAFSEIRGNGGDGGDAMIEFTGLLEMEMDAFSIYVIVGTGGLGRE